MSFEGIFVFAGFVSGLWRHIEDMPPLSFNDISELFEIVKADLAAFEGREGIAFLLDDKVLGACSLACIDDGFKVEDTGAAFHVFLAVGAQLLEMHEGLSACVFADEAQGIIARIGYPENVELHDDFRHGVLKDGFHINYIFNSLKEEGGNLGDFVNLLNCCTAVKNFSNSKYVIITEFLNII